MQLMTAQLIGSAAITAATFAFSMVMFYAVKATGTLRVSKDGELEGLDLHEHGGSAYPEQLMGSTSGMGSSSGMGSGAREPAAAE